MAAKENGNASRRPGRKKEAPEIAEEIATNIAKIVSIEETQKQKRTIGEKLAEWVAAFCGSMVFVYVHIVFFTSWIVWNIAPGSFDPFPFTFLTLIVSLEAIFLSTFILISQNHETKLTERRNHLDLQINMLAEQENTKMLELLHAIAEKVGVRYNDPGAQALLEPTDPEVLVEELVKATDEAVKDVKAQKEQVTT
jgi:uncharacterized membrane protein